MENLIEVNNLCKNFTVGVEDIAVLKNISFEVNKGEFISIMGPSGSGKSTLLYLLGTLDKPTSGVIKLNGKDITKLNDEEESIIRRRNIGFVFQFYNLIPNLTAEENVLLPIALDDKKIDLYKERTKELLEDVGLYEKRNYKPKQLSGGQQQRISIARALINDPDIILADEAIGNLDSKTGNEIMKLLQELNLKRNISIVQVTHASDSCKYGTRTINIKDGEIIKDVKM